MANPQSVLVYTIMCIYGTNDDFVEAMITYMGPELAERYLSNHNIFNDCKFNLKWGKGLNRIICSILRAYIDVYDETIMNEAYLEEEEDMDKYGHVWAHAETFKRLKNLYHSLDGERFIVKVDCPCCFKITVIE